MSPTETSSQPLILNQGSVLDVSTGDMLEACAAAGMAAGLWYPNLLDLGVAETAARARDLNVPLASLCRVGHFTDPDRAARHRENLEVLDVAAELGIPTAVVVVGPVARGLVEDDRAIRDGLAGLVPAAQERGVQLAIEPFHPMLIAERSAVVSLAQALDMAEQVGLPETLGIALDIYHVWWDPALPELVPRALPYVMSVHLSDWLSPTTSFLRGRGRPGDGVIDLAGFVTQLADAHYDGPFEIEILNDAPRQESTDDYVLDLRRRAERLLTERFPDRLGRPLPTSLPSAIRN